MAFNNIFEMLIFEYDTAAATAAAVAADVVGGGQFGAIVASAFSISVRKNVYDEGINDSFGAYECCKVSKMS